MISRLCAYLRLEGVVKVIVFLQKKATLKHKDVIPNSTVHVHVYAANGDK